MSACMFFRTDIYVNSDFSLLPKIEEMNLDSWKNFQSINRTPHIVETGMGMAYQIEQKQQSWYKMDRTNRNQYHEYFAGIFDNRIFHLGSASEYKTRPVRDYENNSIYQRIRTKIANILPINFKQALKFLFPENVLFPEIKRNQNSFIVIREKMLNDIDDFFNYLTE